LGSALAIYLTAEPITIDPLLSEMHTSKKYRREMQVIGGKANVLVGDLMDWFAEQWHGETLARTVAILTVGVTLGFRFVATHPDNTATATSEKKTPRSGAST